MKYFEHIGSRNRPRKCKVRCTLAKKCPGNDPVFISFSYPWSLCDILVSKVSRNCPGFLDLFPVAKDPVGDPNFDQLGGIPILVNMGNHLGLG